MHDDSVAASMIAFLRQHVGDVVTLEFDDGEIVDARLLHVDLEDHEDITYDVVRVIATGANTAYDPHAVYLMPISAIRRAVIPDS
jgi:hypothetical protein